ncbi:MAG: HlyD family efflux transporter periplasmic adaptor subunit [Clostridiaceae bacterium]
MNNLSMERETKPRKKAAKALAGFMAVMALLTIGSRMLENFSMAEVAITRASSGMLERVLETSGTIKISNDEPVRAEDALTVLKVQVSNGDAVEAGAPLVTVDIDLLKEKLTQAQIDLRKKELAKQSASIPTDVTTPEELLANALRAREDANQRVSENEINADLALVAAEETLALNKKLLERSFTKGLASAEEALALAQEDLTKNVTTSQKAYEAAQKKYNEMTSADTGIWATEKAKAYRTYIDSELALIAAIQERFMETDYTSDEQLKVAIAMAQVLAAEAQLSKVNPADAAAYQTAQNVLAAANAALEAAKNYRGLKGQELNEKVDKANKDRDKAYDYYVQVYNETAPDILEQIANALEDQTNKQKAYEKAVKDGNKAVTEAQETLDNTKLAMALWQEGTLISNDERTPAGIETALKSVETSAEALTTAQKNREKVLKENSRTIEDADKALDKARNDAARQTKTDRISAESKKLDNMAAEAELEKAKKSVERLKKLVDTKGIITAPIAGIVSEITASEGASIAEGAVIARIAAGEKSMKIIATVTADEANQLKVGLEAELYSDRMWASGKITDIRRASGTSGQTGGQTMYEVHIGINPGQGDFFVGDSVRITIRQTSQRYNTVIPLSALREDTDGKFVFILEEQSGALGTRQIVRRVDVTVQESNSEKAAVSGAFSEWEKLIERGDRELKNGDRVRVKQ